MIQCNTKKNPHGIFQRQKNFSNSYGATHKKQQNKTQTLKEILKQKNNVGRISIPYFKSSHSNKNIMVLEKKRK